MSWFELVDWANQSEANKLVFFVVLGSVWGLIALAAGEVIERWMR